MRIGAHESIAGGVHEALLRAERDRCEAIQIFSKNGSQWRAKPLPQDEIAAFRRESERLGLLILVHTSYLINLGGAGEVLAKSIPAFGIEMERCEQLGIPFLVLHPGAHLGAGEADCLPRIAGHLRAAIDGTRGYGVRILLENTAGQGTTVGYRFEHLRTLLDAIGRPERTGVCFDTQHAFAAGYDLRTAAACAATMDEFDRIVGLEHLHAFHLNDSLKGIGSRVDRHARIGSGALGTEAFRALFADARFRDTPGILEVPPGPDKEYPFRDQIAAVRRLA